MASNFAASLKIKGDASLLLPTRSPSRRVPNFALSTAMYYMYPFTASQPAFLLSVLGRRRPVSAVGGSGKRMPRLGACYLVYEACRVWMSMQ